MHAGDTVSRNQRLATLIDSRTREVKAYLEERDLLRIKIGDRAEFYPQTPGSEPVELIVTGIDRDATNVLTEALLGSTHGGQIPVRASGETLIPERAIYGVTLDVTRMPRTLPLQQQLGRVVIRGEPRSLIGDYLNTVAAVLIRESGW
jgi:putative peptide zinc metalloprotease protein